MLLDRIRYLFRITRGVSIARRYFFTNGFDGALTMLGLNMGFYVTNHVDAAVVLKASMGTAIALTVSGISSAYISESAEKQKELDELESAMIQNLDASEHGRAAKMVPFVIAIVNGFSPFILAMIIVSPLWFTIFGITLPFQPLLISIVIAFLVVFTMGVLLGKLGGQNWIWTGLRAVLVAGLTSAIIVLADHAFMEGSQ